MQILLKETLVSSRSNQHPGKCLRIKVILLLTRNFLVCPGSIWFFLQWVELSRSFSVLWGDKYFGIIGTQDFPVSQRTAFTLHFSKCKRDTQTEMGVRKRFTIRGISSVAFPICEAVVVHNFATYSSFCSESFPSQPKSSFLSICISSPIWISQFPRT